MHSFWLFLLSLALIGVGRGAIDQSRYAAADAQLPERPVHPALDGGEAIARELTQEDKGRLRVCANDECRWVFRDNSPAGRRNWCDMSSCGNRAKAARLRERQKQKAEPASVAESAPLN